MSVPPVDGGFRAGTARQRCFLHPGREAAARCPSCGRFFCRECVTEHEDRVLCATCLARGASPRAGLRARAAALTPLFTVLAGLFLAWVFFSVLGRFLLNIPTEFHEGTAWRGPW